MIGLRRICRFCRLVLLLGAIAAAPVAQAAEEVVRLGFYVKVTRDLSRAEVQSSLEFWADELGGKFNVPTQVRFYDDMRTLRRDFDHGLVNFVITSSMDFVRHFKVEELAEGFVGSIQVDHTLQLVSRADGDIRDLAQLPGKRIALLKDDELSEVYLETLCLRQHRRACKDVFASMEPIETSNKLALRLFFGKTDLILTRKNGMEVAKEMNPQIGKATRLVRQFPVKSSYYGLFSRRVDKSFRDHALQHLPNMHKNPRGRQVLEVFHVDRLELASETELLPFVRLYQEYEGLLAEVGKERKAR